MTPELLVSKCSSYEELREYLRYRGREAYFQKMVCDFDPFLNCIHDIFVLKLLVLFLWEYGDKKNSFEETYVSILPNLMVLT